MVRRIISLVIALVICLEIPAVFAHPGRTDADGGHTNHETGEYHYHHGYSAHQHYDMDGDGTVDCPYKFKDQANHSTTSSSNNIQQKTAIKNASSFNVIDVILFLLDILVSAGLLWGLVKAFKWLFKC